MSPSASAASTNSSRRAPKAPLTPKRRPELEGDCQVSSRCVTVEGSNAAEAARCCAPLREIHRAYVHVYNVRSDVYTVYMSKDKILAAAKTVLDREGLPGLTIRKVAHRAKVSPMALYRHFADKDALLNNLMEDGLAAWEERARSIRATDPIQWLEALGEAFLDFALKEPHRFDAAFFLPAPKARQYPEDFAAGRSPVVAMALVRVDRAKSDGRMRDAPGLDVTLAFSALLQGLVSMYRANRFSGEKQFKELFRTQIRQCLEGFALKPAGRTR